MIRFILEKIYPSATDPWTQFFSECDARISAASAASSERERATASKLVSASKPPNLFGKKKPNWDDIPETLWAGGNGLCTSFAIAVNEESGLGAKYINYTQHRAAHRINDDTKSVVVIDSAARQIFELDNGGERGNWEDQGVPCPEWTNNEGNVVWKKV
jgi:hypothetical protein